MLRSHAPRARGLLGSEWATVGYWDPGILGSWPRSWRARLRPVRLRVVLEFQSVLAMAASARGAAVRALRPVG